MSEVARTLALIVDDDRDFVVIAEKRLKKLGFNVLSSFSPEEFLDKFKANKVGLCLIDLRLGSSMEGFKLVETLRLRLGSEIPLFVVSGENDSRIITHAMELGATDYIVKPIDSEILASKLALYFVSEEIAGGRLAFFQVPRDQSGGTVAVDFRLKAVDELGVTIVSRNLITKGSVLQILSPAFEEITGKAGSHLMTVVNTWAEPDRESFGAYAEFDSTSEALLITVRRWLLSRTKNLSKP